MSPLPPGNGSNDGPNDGGRKNPWGKPSGGRPRNPWGSGGGGSGGGDPPPDLDELIRRAQANLREVMPGGAGGGRTVVLALAAAAALWLASGLYIVEPGVHGVVQRFGAWHRTEDSEGLHYRLPWPVDSVAKVNVSQMRRMEIGFTELYGRGGAGQKQDIPEESLMLTADANIVSLDLVVLWNVKSADDYLFNIHDPENTIKKVAESAIREAVGQTQMFPIITQARDDVAGRARDIMSRILDGYKSGINVTQVLIQEAEVHPDVQDAFQDVQSAKQDAEDVQNRAGAYREDIIPRARGEAIRVGQEAAAYRQSAVAKAKGDADRFNAVYEAYKVAQDVTRKRIYIETMEEVLQSAQKIIMDDKAGAGVVPYLPLSELKPAAGKQAGEPLEGAKP